jgi:hypothetical protein
VFVKIFSYYFAYRQIFFSAGGAGKKISGKKIYSKKKAHKMKRTILKLIMRIKGYLITIIEELIS